MWLYLFLILDIGLIVGALIAIAALVGYNAGKRSAPAVRVVYAPTPNVARVVAWPGVDLDAVTAAGDRAYLAVRAAQATRVPRRDRDAYAAPRRLAVVA